MEVDHRSWRATRDAEVEQRLIELEEAAQTAVDREELAGEVHSMFDDHQFTRLQANLEYEALRESTDARRLLLAHAAAGLADPKIPIGTKARVERALRQLDHGDIILLRHAATGLIDGTRARIPGADQLISAGCARFEPSGGMFGSGSEAPREVGDLVVTPVGNLVLKAVATYPANDSVVPL